MQNLTLPLKILAVSAIAMWAVYFLNLIAFNHLNSLGIRPRSGMGLIGIVTSPFLHGSFFHLLGNTIPYLILGALIATIYKDDFIDIFVGITVASGLLTWIFGGANTNHIGTSGVIFGLAGFMMGAGFLTKKFIPMGVAIAVIIFYGLPLLSGLLPLRSGVSYVGHWGGLLSGVGMSYLYKVTQSNS